MTSAWPELANTSRELRGPGAVEGRAHRPRHRQTAEMRGISEAMRQAMIERTPLRRMVTADDRRCHRLFASDMARSVSGQVLP
jgi:hypothetical protein